MGQNNENNDNDDNKEKCYQLAVGGWRSKEPNKQINKLQGLYIRNILPKII